MRQLTSVPFFGQDVGSDVEMEEENSSKLAEQRGNVSENKGSASRSPIRNGNVNENTGT
jgi:hypothetical protein